MGAGKGRPWKNVKGSLWSFVDEDLHDIGRFRPGFGDRQGDRGGPSFDDQPFYRQPVKATYQFDA